MAEIDPQKMAMAACLAVAQNGLSKCLVRFGKTKCPVLRLYYNLFPARRSDWLSEFESELVRDIKNTDIGGVPMTSETVMVERAIQFLNSIFDGARRQIAEESEND